MATATAIRGAVDAAVTAGGASHGLASFAQKLSHPLVRIRARALVNLAFKLRERLVDVGAEPTQTVDALMRALLACLAEPELEPSALQVLQLLLLDAGADVATTRMCAAALRRHGAATVFQRGGLSRQDGTTETHATYEALLQRLLASSSGFYEEQPVSPPRAPPTRESITQAGSLSSSRRSLNGDGFVSSAARAADATVSAVAAASRSGANKESVCDPLTTRGWHFPRVALASVDEQALFEFEVKWRLRTSVPEIVEMCDTFRRDLLRNYPAEVFLQRPTLLLRVLELVRQPILPALTTPELSFGVNYFDEPASTGSFVWKPSVQATALHISTLKALEAWLAALRHSMELSLNPIYHTFQSPSTSTTHLIPTTEFDHRRLHYPRVSDDSDRIVREDESSLSLGGAAYLIVATLMRLLSSENYPHLHLLNLIRVATSVVPDRSISPNQGKVNPLDKTRFEALFTVLADVVSSKEKDFDALVAANIVDWVVSVLLLLQPSAFRVEGKSTTGDSDGGNKIEIPGQLWSWLLRWFASDEASEDYVVTTIDLLDQIDASASSSLKQIVRSSELSAHLSAALDSKTHPGTLPLALQVLHVIPNLSEHQRSCGLRIVLDAVCKELDREICEGGEPRANAALVDVLTQCISLFNHENPKHCHDFGVKFFDGLLDWTLEATSAAPSLRLKSLLASVSLSDDFLHMLLSCLAGSGIEDTAANTLWRLAELLFRAFEHDSTTSTSSNLPRALSKSVSVLQHLAYFDSSASAVTDTRRRLQRSLMHLAHFTEATLPAPDQLLFVSRCLLHRSPLVRRAAASGLVERLSQLRSWSVDQSLLNTSTSADPFGQLTDVNGTNHRRLVEQEIPSVLQPRMNKDDRFDSDTTSITSGSSVLNRISRLRKLLSSLLATEDDQPSTHSAVASTLQQLLVDLVHADAVDFSILEESGEVEELMHLSVRLLPRLEDSEPKWFYSSRGSSLSIIRLLLIRSAAWRRLIREDAQTLAALLSFVFDEEPRVRAEVYFVVVALTCCLEVVTLQPALSGLVVPAEFSTTFGLFSERWAISGIVTQDIVGAMKQPTTNKDETLLAFANSSPRNVKRKESLERLFNRLVAATSFRTFLDAVYAVIQGCHAQRDVCIEMSARWEEASFRRYLETPPTSAKDQVVMVAILTLLNVLFDTMPTDQQMDVVLLLRNKIIPLHLAREQGALKTTALPTELARLLLRTSRSSMADMFVPLLIDTGLVKNLGALIVASGVSGLSAHSQRSLWIQVALEALKRTKTDAGEVSGSQELLDALLMPLEAISGRHHVPGSFLEHDSYANAVSCLKRLRVLDSGVNWRGRLLFDTVSTLRSTGFQVAAATLGTDSHDATTRILRLATDTMRDDTESDAVRSSAADLLVEFFRRVEHDAIPLYTSCIDGEQFIPSIIRDMIKTSRGGEKCCVRLTQSRVQLLRFFISHHERFNSTSFGNVLDHFVSDTCDESRPLMAFIELLSVRKAFELYEHHISKFLRMQADATDVWDRSIFPVVLSTVSETAQLLQIIVHHCSRPRSTTLEAAPIVLQIAETIADISMSMSTAKDHKDSSARGSYEALDQCGKLLAVALSTATATSLPSETVLHLLNDIAGLLDPAHPRSFRLSFARVVPVIFQILRCQKGDVLQNPTVEANVLSIGASLWTAYNDLSELQPLDPSISHRRNDSFLLHLRRVVFALHSLLSNSQKVCASLCESRYGAVPFVVQAVRKSFAAVRMMGGFGAKSTKNSDDGFLLELCESIQLHCQLLSGLFAQSDRAKALARDNQLPAIFANNWSIVRAASRKGSGVLVSALRMLQNFIHSSEINKTSLATTIATPSATRTSSTPGVETERNLLALIGDLAIGDSASPSSEERWRSIAGSILKSAFLHVECLHSGLKTGLVNKIFGVVVNRSRRRRESSKIPPSQEEQTLVELVGVLASVACSDEGRQILLQMRELRDLLEDIFQFPEGSKLLVTGSLFVRNMAFSKFSKTHYSVWEPAVDHILAVLYRMGSDSSTNKHDRSSHTITADHLSTALLCFVHDNQRGQSVMQSSRKQMLLLGDAARAWRRHAKDSREDGSGRAATISANLDRVCTLVAGDDDAHNGNGGS